MVIKQLLSSNCLQMINIYMVMKNRLKSIAECTDKMIYVFIDLGNPGRLKKLTNVHKVNIKNDKKVPE